MRQCCNYPGQIGGIYQRVKVVSRWRPGQEQVWSIKVQQASASRERERMIQGIQSLLDGDRIAFRRPSHSVLPGFGEEGLHAAIVGPDPLVGAMEPSVIV